MKCKRCGRENHPRDKGPAKDSKCHKCSVKPLGNILHSMSFSKRSKIEIPENLKGIKQVQMDRLIRELRQLEALQNFE